MIVALICLVALIPAAAIFLAWNGIIAGLVNGNPMQFWQAYVLGFVVAFLFNSNSKRSN